MTQAFFTEHLPQYKEIRHFELWLRWADFLRFIVRVYPDAKQDRILAAAIVRPIRKEHLLDPYLLSDPYAFDEDGDILLLDAAAAVSLDALRALGVGILQRFGPRKSLAFDSHHRGLRLHDFDKARKALLRTRPCHQEIQAGAVLRLPQT